VAVLLEISAFFHILRTNNLSCLKGTQNFCYIFLFYFEIISFLSTIKFISFLKTPYQLSVLGPTEKHSLYLFEVFLLAATCFGNTTSGGTQETCLEIARL